MSPFSRVMWEADLGATVTAYKTTENIFYSAIPFSKGKKQDFFTVTLAVKHVCNQ